MNLFHQIECLQLKAGFTGISEYTHKITIYTSDEYISQFNIYQLYTKSPFPLCVVYVINSKVNLCRPTTLQSI